MSSQDSCPAWYHYSADFSDKDFVDMFGDRRRSFGDLFELVRQGSGSGSGSSMEMQPTLIPSSPLPVPLPQEMPFEPLSENQMAAWLYPIVRGQEIIAGHDQSGSDGVNADQMVATANESSEKLGPSTEGRCSSQETSSNSSERTKAATGVRWSDYAETHKRTEKRRRRKINEKLKTLQQLVPGCDKRNQASTLDQTIQYMKSLQQQIQAMAFGCGSGMKPAPAMVYPAVQPPYLSPPAVAAGLTMLPTASPGMLVRGHVRPGLVLGSPPVIVPIAPMLPLVHHPAVMTHVAQMPYPNRAPLPAREKRKDN